MLKVGLTGNIAAGKSSVAEVWRSLGATVIDADELARRAVEPGTRAHAAIAAQWGDWVMEPGGELDRAALRHIVFADPAARERLESIVHPAVRDLRAEEYREAQERGEPVIVADIPLLFEVGMADEARRMVAAQMPSELKRARADVIVENTGSLGDLERRARQVWEELLRRAE